MTAPLLRPNNPPAEGAHEVHQAIAETVAALDTLRTQVNTLRLNFGDCPMTRKRLAEAKDALISACLFVNDATEHVTVERVRDDLGRKR